MGGAEVGREWRRMGEGIDCDADEGLPVFFFEQKTAYEMAGQKRRRRGELKATKERPLGPSREEREARTGLSRSFL